MGIYIALMALIAVIGLAAWGNEKVRKPGLALCFIALFVVMAFRADSVGADTRTYENLFMSCGGASFLGSMDIIESAPVYNAYSWLLYQAFPYRQAIVICNSAIICVGFYLFIKRLITNWFAATLLFVTLYSYFIAMNTMRQSVAVSLLLVAVVALRDEKRIPAVTLALLACGVHNTAAVVIVFFAGGALLERAGWGMEKVLAVCVAVAVAIMLFYEPLTSLFTHIFPRYEMYTGSDSRFSYLDQSQGRIKYVYLVYGIMLVWACLSMRAHEAFAAERRVRLLFFGACMAISIGVFCTQLTLLARLMTCLLPFFGCYLAEELADLDAEIHSVAPSLFVLTGGSYLCLYQLMSNYSGVLPYVAFWAA